MRGRARIDLVGQRFGKLVVTWQPPPGHARTPYRVRVRCDCGTEKEIWRTHLCPGRVQQQHWPMSCGCAPKQPWAKSIAGKRYGEWTAISMVLGGKVSEQTWLCRCDCGAEEIKPRRILPALDHGCPKCRNYSRWSEAEDKILRDSWRRMSRDQIVAKLKKSDAACGRRAELLGITGNKGNEWDSLDGAATRFATSRPFIKAALTAAGIQYGRRPGEQGQRAANMRLRRADVDRAVNHYFKANRIKPQAKPKKEGWESVDRARARHHTSAPALKSALEAAGVDIGAPLDNGRRSNAHLFRLEDVDRAMAAWRAAQAAKPVVQRKPMANVSGLETIRQAAKRRRSNMPAVAAALSAAGFDTAVWQSFRKADVDAAMAAPREAAPPPPPGRVSWAEAARARARKAKPRFQVMGVS